MTNKIYTYLYNIDCMIILLSSTDFHQQSKQLLYTYFELKRALATPVKAIVWGNVL